MSHIVSRQVEIRWKLNTSVFSMINQKVLGAITNKFGSTRDAVKAILAKENLLKATMPVIVGTGINDPKWQEIISDYWNSLSIDIYESGKPLDLSLSFDVTDNSKKDAILALQVRNGVKVNYTDITLAEAVLKDKTILEEEYYKYATIVNPEEYLLFIYCDKYRDVANKPEDILKASSSIRFYIHDETVAKRNKSKALDLELKATDKYMDLTKDNDSKVKIYNVLCVLEPESITEIDKLTDKERVHKLFKVFQNKNSEFISVVDDVNIHLRALIEQLINKKIIKTLTNTEIVVDSEDATLILGNTKNEVIGWMSSEKNIAKLSEYTAKLKSLNN